MVEVGTEVSKIRKELNDLLDLLKSFTIYSDGNGMITYDKNWDGTKKESRFFYKPLGSFNC